MMKRLLSLVLTAVMCVQMMPLWALGADDCEHTYDWFYDSGYHWKACTLPECGLEEEDTRAAHTWDESGMTCTECGYGGHTTYVDWENDTLTVELIAATGDRLLAALYDEEGMFLSSSMHQAIQDGSNHLTLSGLENARTLKVFSFSSELIPNRPVLVHDLLESEDIWQDNNFAVVDIDISGSDVTAIIQAGRDCTLHIAAYDETNDELLMEKTAPVSAGDTEAALTMEGLPRYFKLRAQLRDENGRGLHETFLCLYYTSAFEGFANQTAADFPADRVLNVGDEGGYAIFKDDVLRLDGESEKNRLVSRTDGIAVFENADEALTSLTAGDKLAFTDLDGSAATALIEAISVSGDTVTITEAADVSVSDFYSSVKINIVALSSDGTETASAEDSGSSAAEAPGITDTTLDITDVELGSAFTFTPKTEVFTAQMKIWGGSKIIFYYDEVWFGKDSMMVGAVNRVKLESTFTFGPNSHMNEKKDIGELPLFGIPNVADISMKLEAPYSVEWATGGILPLNGEWTAGYLYITHNGEESTQKAQEKSVTNGEYSAGGKIELTAGLRASIEAGLLNDMVAISFGAGVGLKAEGELVGTAAPIRGVDEYHACYTCVNGTSSAYLEADVNLDYEITEKLSGTLLDLDLIHLNWTLGKFYCSIFNDDRSIFKGIPDYGSGECPNKGYRVIISTWDNEEEVNGVRIDLNQTGVVWSARGESVWVTHLYPGTYTAIANIEGNNAQAVIKITDSSQKIKLVGEDKTVRGFVTDKVTGEPISGASVSAIGPESTSVSTNANGAYEFTVCEGTYEVSCAATGYEAQSLEMTLTKNTFKNFILHPLIDPGTLSGTVIDSRTGDPIADASVTITAQENSERSQTVHTEADGTYSVLLSEGLYDVAFSADHYKAASTSAGIAPENTTTLDQKLERYRGSLSGTITAQETEEVKFTGAAITVTLNGTEVGSASTGADGIYSIEDLPSGELKVTVSAEGFSTKSGTASIPDEGEGIFNAFLQPSQGSGDLGTVSWELTHDGTLRVFGTGSAGGYSWNTYWGRPSTPWHSLELADKVYKVVVDEGVTDFGRYTFAKLPNLVSVELPDTLTGIGENAFAYCDSLEFISIPGSVRNIASNAFGYNIKVAVFEEGATHVGGLQGTLVERVVIPDTVESFGNYAFNGCSHLKQITFPKNLKNIGHYAFNYSGITSAILPEGLESIGDYAFNSCGELSAVSIPDTVTSMGNGMFVDCAKLTSVRLSANVTSMPSFRRCTNLRVLELPEGVTYIGAYSLEGTTLDKLILPKSLKTIDYGATNGCSTIPVYYRGTQEEWAAIDIVDNSNDALLNSPNVTYNYTGR
ncbi:MAG: leucine-rich repeat protein [Clostridia bacterium]|nr:leucine-rich repeat protein [Clostridia bacterium]